MSKIIDFYKNVLEFIGLEADAHGYISTKLLESKNPVTLDGKRLVLPTQEHLRDPRPTEKVIFHPFSENVCRGESEVLDKLRFLIATKMNLMIANIGTSLLKVLEDQNNHKLLTPGQQELLFRFKSIDEKTTSNFARIYTAMFTKGVADGFLSLRTNRGGKINDKHYARSCTVTFPFLVELDKNPDAPYGVAIRKKDLPTYKELFSFILPNSDITNYYSRGSDHESIPFFMALMNTAIVLTEQLNSVVDVFKDKLDDPSMYYTDTNLLEALVEPRELLQSARRIPPQLGNEGRTKKEDSLVNNTPIYQPPTHQPPTHQPPPVHQNTGNGIDFSLIAQAIPGLQQQNLMSMGNQMQQPQPVRRVPDWAPERQLLQQPNHNQGGYQQPNHQQSGYQPNHNQGGYQPNHNQGGYQQPNHQQSGYQPNYLQPGMSNQNNGRPY